MSRLEPTTMSRKRKDLIAHNEKLPYIKAKNEQQQLFINDLTDEKLSLVISDGCAGTGKTYLAVAAGLIGLKTGKYKRLIITRPLVEAGKSMGYLPGSADEKIDPYLQPMFDEMRNFVSTDEIREFINNGKNRVGEKEIIICPLNFMRGRNFHDAFMILDEGSSANREELMLFITRIGNNSKAVIIGDSHQSDLYTTEYYFNKRKFNPEYKETMAFEWLMDKIDGCEGVSIVVFDVDCVVRNPVIGTILKYMKLEV